VLHLLFVTVSDLSFILSLIYQIYNLILFAVEYRDISFLNERKIASKKILFLDASCGMIYIKRQFLIKV